MAMTEDRVTKTGPTTEIAELERMWDVEAHDPPPTVVAEPRWRPTSRVLLAAWSVVFAVLLLFAPPADDAAPIPAWEALFAVVFLIAIATAFTGLAGSRPWAIGASMAAALLGVVGGVACNVVDHHVGSWWLVETGGFAGLTLMTAAARRT